MTGYFTLAEVTSQGGVTFVVIYSRMTVHNYTVSLLPPIKGVDGAMLISSADLENLVSINGCHRRVID